MLPIKSFLFNRVKTLGSKPLGQGKGEWFTLVAVTPTVAEIYAIDRATGQIRWTMRLGNGQALGTPAFRNGVIYCTGDKLRAISDNGRTGTLLWEADLQPIYAVTVSRNKIYVPATGPYSNAPNNTHALDAFGV